MLIVKSVLSLNSVASDRVAIEKPKKLPAIARKAGWSKLVLADERTMAGAVEFLKAAREAGVVASVGIQASRLLAKGGTATLILVPLREAAMRRLMGAAAEIAAAGTLAAVLAALPESDGGLDMAALLAPCHGYAPVAGEAAALRAAFRARGANLACHVMRVGAETSAATPVAEAEALAGADLPIVEVRGGMTKEPLTPALTKALVGYAADGVAARSLPLRAREPQGFVDCSIPPADVAEGGGQAAENARSVASRIEPMAADRKPDLPRRLGLAEGESADDALRARARAGLEARVRAGRIDDPEAARERLEYELDVMVELRFSNYFLIMLEAVGFARSRGIPLGHGRGSAAGSMVTYALGITNIDPLKHDLLFERFINRDRISLPDIDTDFCPIRRKEVLDHLVSLYGDAHVAQISTYGSLQYKGAIRKAATLLGKQAAGNKAIAALGKRKEEEEVRFRDLAKSRDPDIAEIGGLAEFLNGLNSNSGVHAGGVVLSDDPVAAWAPLTPDRTDDGLRVIQYDMQSTEDAGFVKFDFLGVVTLSIVDHCVKALARDGVGVDLETLPLDDGEVYEMLRRGRTRTVFQLEGGAITRAGREIGITDFEDVVALVALYRPGPMGNIPLYANRKKGIAPVEYLHPVLEQVLSKTYGIIIYQEQIMSLAREFAGYSMSEADEMRRAIGKKKKADVEAQREPFIRKSVEMGRDQDVAEELFEFILPFAQYGFNRSHAVAYSVLAYHTAYLKRHHPGHWYASCLTFCENPEKAAMIVAEAAGSGISIVPPDVNASVDGYSYSVRDGMRTIMLPLSAVKGVGRHAAAEAVAERDRGGPFASFMDFASRVSSFNKAQVEEMAWAGAFDGLSRHPLTLSRPLFAELSRTVSYAAPAARASGTVQMGLFADAPAGGGADPAPRGAAMDPERAATRQDEALQGVLHHERRSIASSAWRRKVESLESVTKAATMARKMTCATMAVLRKQADRVVPVKEGGTRRVIVVTLEDENGTRDFDVDPDFAMGPELVDAKDRCVRVTLGPSRGFSFISGAPEVKSMTVFRDPLTAPREFPVIALADEIDEPMRQELRRAVREVAIRKRARADEAAAAAAKAGRRAPRAAPSAGGFGHAVLAPPSRELDVMPLPQGCTADDLREALEGVEGIEGVLD